MIMDVIGVVLIMMILVLGNHVEVLMESNVIAYVTKNLLYAFTLTLTAMTLSILTMIMNVIQI